jgi:hypothetical protein
MTFAEFKSKFDYPGSVVLLEGKRDVLDENKTNLVNLGLKLASETDHILFRSGNASGSDELFSQGVSEINPKRLEINYALYHAPFKKNGMGKCTIV